MRQAGIVLGMGNEPWSLTVEFVAGSNSEHCIIGRH